MVEVHCGDVLEVLKTFPDDSFDALITDPPYSSGGHFRGDRAKSVSAKYYLDKQKTQFTGDTLDQRSWTHWVAAWLTEAKRVLKDGSPVLVFTDWRQLPTLTDAFQYAGLIWRGVFVWNKGELFGSVRPQLGRFSHSCEFIVWGSKGSMSSKRNSIVRCLSGFYTCSPVLGSKRVHITQKPVDLMRYLVKITKPNGRVLDPFCGSGSTLKACQLEGLTAVGVDICEEYTKTIKNMCINNDEYAEETQQSSNK